MHFDRGQTAREEMQSHFALVAGKYRDLRTTDPAPIHYIKDKHRHLWQILALDIGCGAGRYDLLLFDHLPGLHLTCADINPVMLAEAGRYFSEGGITNFETRVSSVEDLSFENGGFDAVFTFNAVHHFDFPKFLEKGKRFIKENGQIFIYTRLPEQNARSIWGKFFPKFLEKETRLFELAEMEKWVEQTNGLELAEVRKFQYPRKCSLSDLLMKCREKHYSTFSLYSSEELENAATHFSQKITDNFPEPECIEWTDENIMLHLQREKS